MFLSEIEDITKILEITVFNEDRFSRVQFVGQLAIPLTRIHSNRKRWYILKDKNMISAAKGHKPRV